MSRSKRKSPCGGWVASTGQHIFKTAESRSKRHRVKNLLTLGEYINLPHEKEYGNEWDSPRDGKSWWLEPDQKMMRK